MLGRRYRSWSRPSRDGLRAASPRVRRRACAGSPRRGGRPCAARAPAARPPRRSAARGDEPQHLELPRGQLGRVRPRRGRGPRGTPPPFAKRRGRASRPAGAEPVSSASACELRPSSASASARAASYGQPRARHAAAAPSASPASWSRYGSAIHSGASSSAPAFHCQYAELAREPQVPLLERERVAARASWTAGSRSPASHAASARAACTCPSRWRCPPGRELERLVEDLLRRRGRRGARGRGRARSAH